MTSTFPQAKGKAIVKSILSGDSVVIQQTRAVGGPPLEAVLSLSMIVAPRLSQGKPIEGANEQVDLGFAAIFILDYFCLFISRTWICCWVIRD